jgi:uncharacterized protein YneF (UPF0154 family)
MTFPIYVWTLVTVIALLDCVVIGMWIQSKIQKLFLDNSNNDKGNSKKD